MTVSVCLLSKLLAKPSVTARLFVDKTFAPIVISAGPVYDITVTEPSPGIYTFPNTVGSGLCYIRLYSSGVYFADGWCVLRTTSGVLIAEDSRQAAINYVVQKALMSGRNDYVTSNGITTQTFYQDDDTTIAFTTSFDPDTAKRLNAGAYL